MAKEYGVFGKDPKFETLNLSSTLGKLHMWENKLHEEVKEMIRFQIAVYFLNTKTAKKNQCFLQIYVGSEYHG